MVAASISEKMGLLSYRSVRQVAALLTYFNLTTHRPDVNLEDLITSINYDKKVRNGQVRWVLLDRIGHGVINCTVPDNVVRETVKEVCQ